VLRPLRVGQAVGHPTALEPMTEVAIRPPVSVLAGEPRIPLRRPEARWRRWRVPVWPEGAVVGALVVLAAALRLPNLGRAYWVDEGISVGVASHHLTQIPALLRHDGSPPFFYVILHFWLRAFGGSQISTHILSLLISLVVVVVAWWCARRLFGPTVAQFAALLAATSPFLNWYSTETRMYPLLCGLAMVAVTASVCALLRHSGRDFALAIVAFAALLYTHNWSLYLFVLTVVGLVVWALRRGERRDVAWIALGAGVVVVAYLPWLPSFLYQARHTAAPWAVRPTVGDLFVDPASVLGGTMSLIVAPLFAAAAAATWIWRTREDNEVTALIGGIGLATALAGWVAAQVEPSWTSRYLGVALGPILLALAACLGGTWIGRRVAVAAVVILVGWSVVGSLLPDSNATYAKSNVAAIAGAARPFLAPGDLVVVAQSEQVAVLHHYLPPGLRYVTPTGPVADPSVVDWRDIVHRLQGSSACSVIEPEIAALPAGAYILLVNPYKHLGASGTTWARTVNAQVAAVNDLFANDRGVIDLRVFEQSISPKPYSAVVGSLFMRSAAASTCP
jgi:mannosyltransferase